MKKIKYYILLISLIILSCNEVKSPNDLGYIERLPKGEYTIWNTGSRHMVVCMRNDGKYYWLNDSDFKINGIPGYDAHQYYNKTHITIK